MEGIPINKPTKPLGKSVWRKYSFVRIFEITAGMSPIKDSVLLGEVYYRTVSIIPIAFLNMNTRSVVGWSDEETRALIDGYGALMSLPRDPTFAGPSGHCVKRKMKEVCDN